MSKYPKTLGRIEAVWNKLGGEEGVDRFLRGESEISLRKHVVNLDATQCIPYGLELHEEDQPKNRARGQFKWNPDRVHMYLSDNQKRGGVITGRELCTELAKKPVLPATVLDYLLENRHLIPEDWKTMENGDTRYTYFWGHIYRDQDGNLYVRCLYFRGGQWSSRCRCLDYDWDGDRPAALAS